MAENDNKRLNDARLDASLSVLGDEGKEPPVGRVGPKPAPTDDKTLEEALEKDGSAHFGEGSHSETSERAAKDAMRDVVDREGKS